MKISINGLELNQTEIYNYDLFQKKIILIYLQL